MISVGGSTQSALATADSGDSLTDYIRISPAFEGTQFQGLVVYANARSDVFFRMGLQEGDVITSVDGTVSPDQESALAALRPLTKGQALSVTVQRDGHSQVLSLDGSLIL
jgi:type II secretion system protein C